VIFPVVEFSNTSGPFSKNNPIVKTTQNHNTSLDKMHISLHLYLPSMSTQGLRSTKSPKDLCQYWDLRRTKKISPQNRPMRQECNLYKRKEKEVCQQRYQ
jgi:hypothetical protein